MIHILKMWWMIRKTMSLQYRSVYIQKDEGRDLNDKEILSRAIFRRDDIFIPRYLLSLPYRKVCMLKNITAKVMTDRINSINPISASKRQDTVKDCLTANYLTTYEKDNSTLITVTTAGRMFSSFSGLLIKELDYLRPLKSFFAGSGLVIFLWIIKYIVNALKLFK